MGSHMLQPGGMGLTVPSVIFTDVKKDSMMEMQNIGNKKDDKLPLIGKLTSKDNKVAPVESKPGITVEVLTSYLYMNMS